jgi:hypothetical protein
MGTRKTSLSHVADAERLLQSVKTSHVRDDRNEKLEELSILATMAEGVEEIRKHDGVDKLVEWLKDNDVLTCQLSALCLERMCSDTRARLTVVTKLTHALKAKSPRTKLYATTLLANLAKMNTQTRAAMTSAGAPATLLAACAAAGSETPSAMESATRLGAVGCIYWLTTDESVCYDIKQAREMKDAAQTMSSRAMRCGTSGPEKAFSIAVLTQLEDESLVPAAPVIKCLKGMYPPPDESFLFIAEPPAKLNMGAIPTEEGASFQA